ncbi:SMP-30/gluconolactonase/LRE family protein [Amaricoccus macauensis]|uniref:SMP-30/gluconolactonase/LRE family protein n=1 Tax=Amaricoccus macauensis TaxID=57001 RepID=UPI003C798F41
MKSQIFDERQCELGEGPFWHPERKQFFWFDILGKRLFSRLGDQSLEWDMEDLSSAAGWVDRDTLLIATETGLYRFSLATGKRDLVVEIEADDLTTRSNDGRADTRGGFWIGTMGKAAEAGKGSIYRYYRGDLRRIVAGITIPNAICFDPSGDLAYYACSTSRQIFRQPLDDAGWPDGPASVFIDLQKEEMNPDGAVVDQEGCIWNAQWGASRVARYRPDGAFDRAVPVPARQASCPAFGGEGGDLMLVTSAREGLVDIDAADGQTFLVSPDVRGVVEPKVRI